MIGQKSNNFFLKDKKAATLLPNRELYRPKRKNAGLYFAG